MPTNLEVESTLTDRLRPVEAAFVQRLQKLAGNIQVDLNAELSTDDE